MSWKKGTELRYIYQTCSWVRLCTKIQPQSKHVCLSSSSSLDPRRPTVILLRCQRKIIGLTVFTVRISELFHINPLKSGGLLDCGLCKDLILIC